MNARGTDAEKLADVLEVLQLARKTGLLMIERDRSNGVVEQGTITLVNGQITGASLGNHRDTMALKFLMEWKRCHFVLYPPSSNPILAPPERGKGAVQPPVPSAPYRLRTIDDVLPHFERLKLSRSHRQLFLMVDGQRTLKELMWLMHRGPDEIEVLLSDLARVGLIRL